jgi:hypothetical protein
MAQRGALVAVKRWAYGEEASLAATPAAWIDPHAYSDTVVTADYVMNVDGRQLGARKKNSRSHKGPKVTKFATKMRITEDSNTILGPFIKAALGLQVADSPLVINAGGTNNVTTGTLTSGTPDPVVKITYDSGVPDYLPVKTYNATTITWAIQTRIAARTVSSYKNANQCTGDCYQQDPTANFVSFSIQADQGSEPDAESYLLQGLVPMKLELELPLQDRAGFMLEMEGSDWDGPSYAETDIEEQPAFSEEFLGYAWDVHIQSLGSPAAPTQQPLVSISGLNLAPTWIKQAYAKGRTSTGTVPGSDIAGWRQGQHFTQPLVITLDIQDTDWVTAFEAETKYLIHMVGYSGDPSDAATKVMTITFFEAYLDKKPEPTDVNGVVGHALTFLISESTDTTHQTQCAVAFFNS